MKRVLLLLFLLSACVAQPYVQPGVNNTSEEKVVEKVVVQCWDGSSADSLEQCPFREEDVKEKEPAKIVVEAAEVPIAQKLLNDAKGKFTRYAFLLDNSMVIVSDKKVRHLFLKLGTLDDRSPVTDVFVDLEKKEAVAYCNVEREGRMLDDSFDIERSRCKDYLDKPIPVSYDKWLPKGPLDYLAEFATLEPILVENNIQTISIGGNSKTIQPSLHYMIDGKRVILRIDRRYQVPLKIEREGEQSIDFRDAYFDVMVLYGSQEKITEDWLVYTPVSEYWKAAAEK